MTNLESIINRNKDFKVYNKVELYRILENSKCEPIVLEKLITFFNDYYEEKNRITWRGESCPSWNYCYEDIKNEIRDSI